MSEVDFFWTVLNEAVEQMDGLALHTLVRLGSTFMIDEEMM